jgi:hypothetical protein
MMKKYPSGNNDKNYRGDPGPPGTRFLTALLITFLVFIAILCGPVIAKLLGIWSGMPV